MQRSLLRILYEDAKTLAIHKPANVALNTAGYNGAANRWRELLHDAKLHVNGDIWPVHRLDSQVSGVLLLAKTKRQASVLARQFKEGQIRKTYLAAVYNEDNQRDAEGIVQLHVRRTETGVEICEGSADGAQVAVTSFKTLCVSENKRFSLLHCESQQSGRKHQIRLTLSRMGYPIVGDFKYASDSARAIFKRHDLQRIMLHAQSVEYDDWSKSTGKRFKRVIGCDLYEDFGAGLKALDLQPPVMATDNTP